MKAAVDTNILAYAEGLNGAPKKAAALSLIERLPGNDLIIPAQVLSELFNVLTRKAHQSPRVARAAILRWHDAFPVVEASSAIVIAAMDLAADHRFGIWDAVIFSAAAEAGCRILLSEDLQDGFTRRGVTVVNPFAVRQNALLRELIGE